MFLIPSIREEPLSSSFAFKDRVDVTRQNLNRLRCTRPVDCGRSGVVRVSACARQQIFLSGCFAVYGEWSLASGHDCEEDAAAVVNLHPIASLRRIRSSQQATYFSPNQVMAVSFPLSMAAMRAYPCCQSWPKTSPLGEVTTLKGRGMVSP